MNKLSISDLVVEHNRLDDFVSAETKRFTEHLKKTKTRIDEIKSILLGMLNEQKANSFATDAGTCYISTITTPKVIDRDKYLAWINENWETFGNEMLQVGAPQRDAIKEFLEGSGNQPPPGTEVNYLNRLNIRRS